MPDPTSSPAPDTKDWTWVLDRRCEECGVTVGELSLADLPGLLRESALRFGAALRGPGAAVRPEPGRWSALEYACHVRDVHRVFAERLELMLTHDAPEFENWDQDAAAVRGRYHEQDPVTVDVELIESAGTVAGLYAAVPASAAARTGVRSNGSRFTVLTLGRYHLHDVLHHLHDLGVAVPGVEPGVRSGPAR